MQTSWEVVDGLLRSTGAERVGFNENVWGDTLRKWATQGLPTGDDGKPVSPAKHVAFTMFSRQIWERDYRPHVVEDPAARVSEQTLANVKAAVQAARGADKLVMADGRFVWESMRGAMGDENLYIAMAEDPDWMHAYSRAATGPSSAGAWPS